MNTKQRGADILWCPPDDVWSTSQCGKFAAWLRRRRGLAFETYHDLWAWSVDDIASFWSSVWEYFSVVAHDPPSGALLSERMPGASWFPGARLNYAEHMLRSEGSAPVVIGKSQSRPDVRWTMPELRDTVARCRRGLQRLGVGPGDRVAAYLPNIPETLAALLATASLGAIWSSCAPEFGSRSVIDRFKQIRPKVLLGIDGYSYGERLIDRGGELQRIAAEVPGVESTVVLPYARPIETSSALLGWDDLVAEQAPLEFTPVAFNDPLYILYSSGTTGLPKPIVHGHGGILLEHLKVISFHLDVCGGDRFFWYSTTGWMMWNLLISGLLVGACVILFDGNPGWPDQGALWDLIGSESVTYFGVSAPFLTASAKSGLEPSKRTDLSSLRGIGSTGAPLPPDTARWVYTQVPDSVQLGSSSGGTDVCTGFVGAVPLLPVTGGEIPCRCLGAKVEAFDASGNSIVDKVGELVITKPMPSMPVGFWGDDGTRLKDAYFDTYPGVWRHGDWITITSRGGCIIHGRSDATLNRGGVRLGTAEYYSLVEGMQGVLDSLVVHLANDADGPGELLLFVVPSRGQDLPNLKAALRMAIRAELSPRHVPDRIEFMPAVPRTLSGKKLEVPVKRILEGADPTSLVRPDALSDPDSLKPYVAFRARRNDQ